MRKSTLRTTRRYGKPKRESASTWSFTIRKGPISHLITERRLKYISAGTTKLKRPHGTLNKPKYCLDNGVHYNHQLIDQFNISRNLAKSVWGLIRRVISKITGYTLGVYIDKLFGLPPLNIKDLIFN